MTESPRPSSHKWFALVALAVAGAAFLLITAGGIGKNLVYYWGPSELRAAGDTAVGATIRLGGLVAKGSVVRKPGEPGVEFDVVDGAATVHVQARQVPPQMFREGIGVVVEGTLTKAGYFESSRLMVSHDNEYRAPGDKYQGGVKRLMKTTKGLEGDEPRPAP